MRINRYKRGVVASIMCLIGVLGILFCPDAHAAPAFNNETLRYVITYKWGLIHKDTGEATLSLRKKGDRYDLKLTAKTMPWADRFYRVRDTLMGAIKVKDLKPIYYSKITHEKKYDARDDIKYSFNGGTTIGHSTQTWGLGENASKEEKKFSATGPVYDMLSVFYYLRKLDYAQLNKNKIYTATIFSGSQKETIKIRSLGKEEIKLRNKTKREAYHIKFNFTRDGGKKSSDDIDTWISTDSDHIPLYVVGKLPVGEVRAYYMGS